jgi:Leucine-rich repeat (LRR) protein
MCVISSDDDSDDDSERLVGWLVGWCRFLHNNKLTGTLPASMGSLINLQVLDLNKNLLSGSIPSSFGALRDLTTLYASVMQRCRR